VSDNSEFSSRSATFLLLVVLWTAHLRSSALRISQFIELFQKFPVSLHDAHLAAYRTWVFHSQPRGNPFGTRRRPPPDQGGHHGLSFIAFPQAGQLRRTGWQFQLPPILQNQPLGVPLAVILLKAIGLPALSRLDPRVEAWRKLPLAHRSSSVNYAGYLASQVEEQRLDDEDDAACEQRVTDPVNAVI
jgi:hypothetical protein